MSKIDVDIYVSQMIRFFDSNPKDLFTLIGDMEKEIFYERIKQQSLQNYDDNGDASLTKKQMVEIVANMYNEIHRPVEEEVISTIFLKTKFGDICLN
jgi:Ca2+-binding EF-hand superfamily protein